MSPKTLFLAIATVVLTVVLVLLVVGPALERGGPSELLVLGIIIVAVLLIERWIRRL